MKHDINFNIIPEDEDSESGDPLKVVDAMREEKHKKEHEKIHPPIITEDGDEEKKESEK